MADKTNSNPRDWSILEKFIDMGDGTWALRVVAATGGVGNEKTVISSNGSVGAASATIIPAGTFASWVTIQNTHASQTLSISANTPALTTDFTIQPGAALTLPFGIANILYGIGSGAGTTFALIGA